MNDPAVFPDMGTDPPKFIEVPGIKNLRDVGGVGTSSGERVASGRVFRSAQLGVDEPETLSGLRDLGVDMVFDLRTFDETLLLPDVVPDGLEVVHLDVLAGTSRSIAAGLEDLFNDPVAATDMLLQGSIREHYLDSYRDLVSLDSARESYRTLFTHIAEGGTALFHCTAGKDRTGWAAASLQLLLGVPFDVVNAHYLASNEPVLELFRPVLDFFTESGGQAELLEPLFLVDTGYLESAMAEVGSRFGDIDGYFTEGLGLSVDAVGDIRKQLLQSG